MAVELDPSKIGGSTHLRTGLLLTGLQIGGLCLVLAQEVLSASLFGARPAMDSYLEGWVVPNVVALLVGTTLQNAAIPFFAEIRGRAGTEEAWNAAGQVVGLAALVYLAVAVIGIASAPWVLPFVTGPTGGHSLAALIYPLGFLYAGLSLVASLLGGFLAASGRFLLPTVASNMIILAPVLALGLAGHSLGVLALPIGLLIAAAGQLGFLFVAATRQGFRLQAPKPEALRRMAKLFVEAAALVLAALPTLPIPVLERHFGSKLGPGTVSHLFYASKLVSATVRVFSTAINAMGLSLMSAYLATGQLDRFKRLFNACFRVGLYAAVAAIVGFSIEGQTLLRLALQRGAFSATDTVVVAAILRRYGLYVLYGLALPAVSAGLIASGAARRLIVPNACGLAVYLAVASLALGRRDPNLLALAYGSAYLTVLLVATLGFVGFGGVKLRDVSAAFLRAGVVGLVILITASAVHLLSLRLGLNPLAEITTSGALSIAGAILAGRVVDPETFGLFWSLAKRLVPGPPKPSVTDGVC